MFNFVKYLLGTKGKPKGGDNQKITTQYVMFYNLDNLYDTVDDPKTNDDEYTPTGAKRWTKGRYYQKLSNLADVIAAVAADKKMFPAMVGVSEVENKTVLKDLVSQNQISKANYSYIHYESGDQRGVDVGLLYRPDVFQVEESTHIKLKLRSGREYLGRDVLVVRGRMDNVMYCIYVCHLTSRRAGTECSAGFRRAGTETIRDHAAEMRQKYPFIKVIVMGDMNDNPCDESLADLLGAKRTIQESVGGYFNPFWQLYDMGYGSSMHGCHWMMFDNIIVDDSIIFSKVGDLTIKKIGKYYGEVFSRPFMLQSGKEPKRTYIGDKYKNGYSDHLPVLIKLESNF